MKNCCYPLILFLLIISSCNKNEDSVTNIVCDFEISLNDEENILSQEQTDFYFQIWKDFLLQKNNMSQSYFNEHITDITLASHEWDGGITFRVYYIFNIDWINIKGSDKFMVKMNSSYDIYRHLNIERDVFFNSAQIDFNIQQKIKSEISFYNIEKSMEFDNCNEVYIAIKNNINRTDFSMLSTGFYDGPNYPNEGGDPYIHFTDIINSEENRCLEGTINLYSGKVIFNETPCIIN